MLSKCRVTVGPTGIYLESFAAKHKNLPRWEAKVCKRALNTWEAKDIGSQYMDTGMGLIKKSGNLNESRIRQKY